MKRIIYEQLLIQAYEKLLLKERLFIS